MEPSEIIRVIREALHRHGTNPSRFAKDHGFPINAIRYILEGRSPSSRRLAEVCDALGLEFYVGLPRGDGGSPRNLKGLATELERLAVDARRMAADEPEPPLQIDQSDLYASAPRYDVLAAAGTGATVGDEDIKGHLGFNKSWLREQRLATDRLAVIEVTGDSMEPTLRDQDIVLLDMRMPTLQDGEIYTLNRDNELLVKRLRRQGDSWLMVSDNIDYPVQPVDETVRVVGRVVWLGRTLTGPS